MPIRMFHATTETSAAAILAEGFRDGFGFYKFVGLDDPMRGVWLSRVPFGMCEGAKGQTVVEVMRDMTEAEIAEYAIIEGGELPPGLSPEQMQAALDAWEPDPSAAREWLMPAEVINTRGRVRLLSDDDEIWATGFIAGDD